MAGVAVAQPPASLHQGNSSKPSLPCPFVQHSWAPDRSKGKGRCNAGVTAMTTAAGIGIGVAVGLLILAWVAVGHFGQSRVVPVNMMSTEDGHTG